MHSNAHLELTTSQPDEGLTLHTKRPREVARSTEDLMEGRHDGHVSIVAALEVARRMWRNAKPWNGLRLSADMARSANAPAMCSQQEASPLDAETEQCDERRLTAVF
jgi:hypothetical protein